MGNVRSHEKVHIARGHKIQINESEMIHFCEHCKEDNKDIIGRKAFLNHKKLHSKINPVVKSYSCKLCNYVSSKWNLKRHIVSIHQKSSKRAAKHNLSRHHKRKKIAASGLNERVNQNKENSRSQNQMDENSANQNVEQLHQCKYCCKTFRRGWAVKQHEEMCKETKNEKLVEVKSAIKFEPIKCEPIKCKPLKCEPIKSEPLKFEPTNSEPKRSKLPYVCDICERKCQSPSKLELHKRIDTGEKPYSCSFCTLKFRQIIHVQGHERVHVTKEHVRKYNESDMIHFCKICSKDFIGPENLRKHQELHGNTVSHLCLTCGKEFGAPSRLEKHKMIHTGEKPFSCTYCTVKFRSKGNVRNHEKVHIARGHKIQKNESKMFHFCQYCNKEIIGKKAFLIHKNLHTTILESIVFNPLTKSYSCKLCNMKVSTKCNLKRHIAGVHEGKKAFKERSEWQTNFKQII